MPDSIFNAVLIHQVSQKEKIVKIKAADIVDAACQVDLLISKKLVCVSLILQSAIKSKPI